MSTGTDVAVPDGQGAALALPNTDLSTLGQLEEWLKAATIAQQIAAVMASGPFAPRGFRGNADATAAAIMAGMELGFTPSRALRSFYVVEGTATLSAEAMRALILSKGHAFEVVERNADRCTVRAQRRGESEWTEITWTIDDAIRAQLVQRKPDGTLHGSRDPWWKYPATMLANRATTDLAKLKFADVIGGIPGMEELQDADPATIRVEATVSERAERPTAAAILAASVKPEGGEPEARAAQDFDASDRPEHAPVERAVLPITEAQLRKLGVVFGQIGVTGPGSRADRLRIASHLVGRPLESSKDLTLDEARTLIDTLEGNGVEIAGNLLGWSAAPISGPPEVRASDDGMGDADPDGDVNDASGEGSWGPMTEGTDDGWPEPAQPGQQP